MTKRKKLVIYSDKKTPKLIVYFDKETHQPIYMGTATQLGNGEVIEDLHGSFKQFLIPIPIKDCNTCEIYLKGKCDKIAYNEETDTSLCPYDKEE